MNKEYNLNWQKFFENQICETEYFDSRFEIHTEKLRLTKNKKRIHFIRIHSLSRIQRDV